MALLTDLGRRLRSEGRGTTNSETGTDTMRPHATAGRHEHDDGRGTDRRGADTSRADTTRSGAAVAPARERFATGLRSLRANVTVPDVAAIVVLLAATTHLVARDGGRGTVDALPVLVVAAIGTIVLGPSLRRSSRVVVWLVAAWALAPLVALAAAEIRAGAVRPLIASALAPPVAFAALHLWRRPWGPAALGVVLAVTAARSWYGTFLAWWGGSDARPTWLALSWHNQSGTLMGTLGVAGAAVAAVTRGRPRVTALVIGGAALAGAWLSGSRGAAIATAMGMTTVAIGLARGRQLRTALPALVGVMLVAAVAVAGLELMVQGGDGQPITSRQQSATQNLSARFGHWQAAAGMAASRPVTGWGPGSYRWASIEHYPNGTNLTASTHNEYLEVAAESGLVGAAPVWFAAGAVALLAIGAVARRRDDHLDAAGPDDSRTGSRRAGMLAAAGGVTVLGVHAGLDFDWDYPLLIALFAIGAAVLWADRAPRRTFRKVGVIEVSIATFAALLALAVAIAGAALTNDQDLRWDLDGRLYTAAAAAEAGDLDRARAELEAARAWNPGARSLPVVAAVVEHHAGSIDDAALAASVSPLGSSHGDQLLVAQRLYRSGNPTAARQIADDLVPVLESRLAWGVQVSVAEVAALTLATQAAIADCDSAQALAPQVLAWARHLDVPAERLAAALVTIGETTDCRLGPVG